MVNDNVNKIKKSLDRRGTEYVYHEYQGQSIFKICGGVMIRINSRDTITTVHLHHLVEAKYENNDGLNVDDINKVLRKVTALHKKYGIYG